jgi:transketolase
MITVTGQKDTRSGFGDGIVEIARTNPEVVALTADLAGSLKLNQFIKEFPDRFFKCGIAEANMRYCCRYAIGGKIPYTTTFANFSTAGLRSDPSVGRLFRKMEDLRIPCRPDPGEDGATHQIWKTLA